MNRQYIYTEYTVPGKSIEVFKRYNLFQKNYNIFDLI